VRKLAILTAFSLGGALRLFAWPARRPKQAWACEGWWKTMLSEDQLRALVERLAAHWRRGDVSASLADFADHAVLVTPERRYIGRAAISAALEDFYSQVARVEIDIGRIVADAHTQRVAVEWRWSETARVSGTLTRYDDAIVGELRDGKIVYWREYITPSHPDADSDGAQQSARSS
jgi:uncharacterized protein (TIGR02246 family)